MSRGLGGKQQLIMRALENNEVIILSDLMPCAREYIKKYGDQWLEKAYSDSNSLQRAARTLAKKGMIKKVRYRENTGPYKSKYLLAYSKCCWTS